jgi:hypothetical protein
MSKTTADREKLVPVFESAVQIYPATGLTIEAPKCVLASFIVPWFAAIWISDNH